MSKVSALFRTPARLYACKKGDGPCKRDSWRFKLAKFAFNLSGYNKYGLYTDDVMDTDPTVVQEALRRLPKDVLDARNFRLIRAIQLDFLEAYLPREKWTTFEQDVEYRYLAPYLAEVIAERMEIYNFGCSNYRQADWTHGEARVDCTPLRHPPVSLFLSQKDIRSKDEPCPMTLAS